MENHRVITLVRLVDLLQHQAIVCQIGVLAVWDGWRQMSVQPDNHLAILIRRETAKGFNQRTLGRDTFHNGPICARARQVQLQTLCCLLPSQVNLTKKAVPPGRILAAKLVYLYATI